MSGANAPRAEPMIPVSCVRQAGAVVVAVKLHHDAPARWRVRREGTARRRAEQLLASARAAPLVCLQLLCSTRTRVRRSLLGNHNGGLCGARGRRPAGLHSQTHGLECLTRAAAAAGRRRLAESGVHNDIAAGSATAAHTCTLLACTRTLRVQLQLLCTACAVLCGRSSQISARKPYWREVFAEHAASGCRRK